MLLIPCAFDWHSVKWPAFAAGDWELGRRKCSKSPYSVGALNLKVGYESGDHFLFYTVPTWQKMLFQRENKQTELGLNWIQPVQELA